MPIDEIGPDSEVTTPTLICACAEWPIRPAASARPKRPHFRIAPSPVWRSFDLIPDALSRKRWEGPRRARAGGSSVDLSPDGYKLTQGFQDPRPACSLHDK